MRHFLLGSIMSARFLTVLALLTTAVCCWSASLVGAEPHPPAATKPVLVPDDHEAAMQWVAVDFTENDGEDPYSYLGMVSAQTLQRLSSGAVQQPAFIALHRVCWWEYDEQGEISDLRVFEDDVDTGTVYLAVPNILRIVVMKQDPFTSLDRLRERQFVRPIDPAD